MYINISNYPSPFQSSDCAIACQGKMNGSSAGLLFETVSTVCLIRFSSSYFKVVCPSHSVCSFPGRLLWIVNFVLSHAHCNIDVFFFTLTNITTMTNIDLQSYDCGFVAGDIFDIGDADNPSASSRSNCSSVRRA